MSKKRIPSNPSVQVAWIVREGKECYHAGIEYRSGDIFPFDDLTLDQQNLHLPNLERKEVESEPVVAPCPLPPEEIVEVLTQEQAEDGDLL